MEGGVEEAFADVRCAQSLDWPSFETPCRLEGRFQMETY
jgi:hypothetical protein